MSRNISHLLSSAAPAGVQALGAGAVRYEEVSGNRKATGSILYTALVATNTLTINGTVFTVVASGATGNQINVGGSLSATLDAVVTALNASTVEGVALATYAKGGSSDTLTVTYDTYGAAGNAFTLAGSVGTVSGAVLTGGDSDRAISPEAETTLLVTPAGGACDFVLTNGVEGQEKTLYLKTKGSGASALVSGLFNAGAGVATFDTAGDWIKLKWLAGAWRTLVANSVTIA